MTFVIIVALVSSIMFIAMVFMLDDYESEVEYLSEHIKSLQAQNVRLKGELQRYEKLYGQIDYEATQAEKGYLMALGVPKERINAKQK